FVAIIFSPIPVAAPPSPSSSRAIVALSAAAKKMRGVAVARRLTPLLNNQLRVHILRLTPTAAETHPQTGCRHQRRTRWLGDGGGDKGQIVVPIHAVRMGKGDLVYGEAQRCLRRRHLAAEEHGGRADNLVARRKGAVVA